MSKLSSFNNIIKALLVAYTILALGPQLLMAVEYVEQEISFQSKDKSNKTIRLSGTLVLPTAGHKHPAVIFIGGAGPYTKKNGSEPFDKLARHFAEIGIASLYYDKRGSGESKGEFLSSTTMDFAQDVEHAIEFLHTVKDIDSSKIGLFGHSEGGLIATMMGAWRTDLAFIILYGAPAIKLNELNKLRKKSQVEAAIKYGAPKQEGQALLNIFEALDSEVIKKSSLNEEQSLALAENVILKAGQEAGLSEGQAKEFVAMILNEYKTQTSIAWYKAASKINPLLYFELITPSTPILVVNGEADEIVPHELNIPKIRDALAKTKNPDVEIVTIPNINHDYARTDNESLSKELLEVFTSWLKKRMPFMAKSTQ